MADICFLPSLSQEQGISNRRNGKRLTEDRERIKIRGDIRRRKMKQEKRYRGGIRVGNAVIAAFLLCVLLLAGSVLTGAGTVQAASFSKKAPSVTSNLNGTAVTLRWTKRTDLTGYLIYLTNASGGNRKLVKTVKGTSCTRSGLKRGKTYYYRVRGYQKAGSQKKYTSYSKVIKVKVPAAKVTVAKKSTLKQFLQIAMQPVGSTMYVWGGGWNKADTGAGTEARTIGVSSKWKAFFRKQNAGYDYRTTKYQISNGLDCSGYVGWCVYNAFNTKNGQQGYVMLAQNMAKKYSSYGWGTYIPRSSVKTYRAGDIMSSSCSDCGHVWIVVGSCSDGSVVIAHSSPPGVQLCGTPSKSGKQESEAVKLARTYMKRYFPSWYKKYPNCSRGSSYLKHYSQMRWSLGENKVMSDPDGYRNMSAKEILKDLFEE